LVLATDLGADLALAPDLGEDLAAPDLGGDLALATDVGEDLALSTGFGEVFVVAVEADVRVNVRDWVAVSFPPCFFDLWSWTCTVMLNVPGVAFLLGNPPSPPADVSLSPLGRRPLATFHLYGATPPVA